jgi:hypothetical protein
VPIQAPTIGRFVAIAAGPEHVLYVTGVDQFVHPGMDAFGIRPRITVEQDSSDGDAAS